jgi:hypothetical protein
MRYGNSDWDIPKDWQAHLALQFGLPVILLTMGIFVPAMVNARQGDLTLLWVAVAFAVTGVALLFFAKLPLYRQGKYLTFGSRAMPRGRRIAYRIAYGFIGASLLLMLLLLAVLR